MDEMIWRSKIPEAPRPKLFGVLDKAKVQELHDYHWESLSRVRLAIASLSLHTVLRERGGSWRIFLGLYDSEMLGRT